MNILIILAHPDPKSFNHAIAQTCLDLLRESGHETIFHDLYAEKFDPVLPAAEIPQGAPVPPAIAAACAELKAADGLVIVHPNWWSQPPAILTGWVDRVFRPGVAYRFAEGDMGDGVPECLLAAKAAVILNTANTFPSRLEDVFHDPLETLWQDSILNFCGVWQVERRIFTPVVTSTLEQRQAWLGNAAELIRELFPAEGGK